MIQSRERRVFFWFQSFKPYANAETERKTFCLFLVRLKSLSLFLSLSLSLTQSEGPKLERLKIIVVHISYIRIESMYFAKAIIVYYSVWFSVKCELLIN